MTKASGSSSISIPLRSTQRTSSWLRSPVWRTMRLMSASVSGRSGSLQQLPQPVQRNLRYFSPVDTSFALYQRPRRWSRASLTRWCTAEVDSRVAQVLGSECKVVQVKLSKPFGIDAVGAKSEPPGAHPPTSREQRIGSEHHAARRGQRALGVSR